MAAHMSHRLLPCLCLGTPAPPPLPGPASAPTQHRLAPPGGRALNCVLMGFRGSGKHSGLVSFVGFSLEGGSKLLSSYQKEP